MRPGLLLLAAALLAVSAHAQPARRGGPTYNNGPRDVPAALGDDLARARRLGLGARRVMEAVVWRARPPPAAWFAAAGTEAPRDFLWPVEGGALWQAFGSMGGRHRALDIGLRCGATIRAAHGGLVVYSDNFLDGLGNAVVTVAPGGWVAIYGHARRTLVPAGAMVTRGQPIAEMGDTGAAVGCHVHFALLRDGVRVDPAPRMVGRPRPSSARRAPAARGELRRLPAGQRPLDRVTLGPCESPSPSATSCDPPSSSTATGSA